MNAEQEKYLKGKTTGGLLTYVENTWGVRLAISVDVTWVHTLHPVAHVTVTVPNAIHRMELNDPPSVQRATKLNASRDLGAFVNGALIDWLRIVEDHMREQNG